MYKLHHALIVVKHRLFIRCKFTIDVFLLRLRNRSKGVVVCSLM